MTDSNKSISLLRQRMIEDMTMRKLSPKTQSGYIRAVRKLAQYLRRSPDTATAEELRQFQLHLVELGVSSITLNATITGLRFFFEITVNRPDALTRMSHVYEPRKLPVI
jgi:integrase/recombinase XerD